MKATVLALTAAAIAVSTPVLAGDPVVGKQKATACVVCHGSENFGGIFYTLQLAGRNADKLAIKTNKYKTFKVLHPMMNMAAAFYTEKEIEDVSAYYQSIGKPFLTSPFFTIKGDDEAKPAAAAPATSVAPVAAAPYAVATK
jgi:cytochrome c553